MPGILYELDYAKGLRLVYISMFQIAAWCSKGSPIQRYLDNGSFIMEDQLIHRTGSGWRLPLPLRLSDWM